MSFCPSCGKPTKPTNKFCTACGYKLVAGGGGGGAAASSTPAPTPAPAPVVSSPPPSPKVTAPISPLPSPKVKEIAPQSPSSSPDIIASAKSVRGVKGKAAANRAKFETGGAASPPVPTSGKVVSIETLRRNEAEALQRMKKQAEEEAERNRVAAEEERKRQEAKREAEERRRQQQEEAEARRRAEAEAESQRRAEAEAQKRELAAQRRAAEEEEAEAQQRAAEALAQRKAEEAEAKRIAARRKAEEEAEAAAQRRVEEAESQRKADEAEAKRVAAAAKRKAEEEAEAQRKAEALARKKAEEEAEAQRKAEALAKKKAEEAEAKRLAAIKREEEAKKREQERQETLPTKATSVPAIRSTPTVTTTTTSQDDMKPSGGLKSKSIGGMWEQNMAQKKEEQFQKDRDKLRARRKGGVEFVDAQIRVLMVEITKIAKVSPKNSGRQGVCPAICYGDLFATTQGSMPALSAILHTARKKGVVTYDGEMLMQGLDDDVLITLLKDSIEDSPDFKSMLVKRPKEEKETLHPTKCNGCAKTVYPMERLAANGKVFHKGCFRCEVCKRVLELKAYAFLNEKFYCESDFKAAYMAGGGNYTSAFN